MNQPLKKMKEKNEQTYLLCPAFFHHFPASIMAQHQADDQNKAEDMSKVSDL